MSKIINSKGETIFEKEDYIPIYLVMEYMEQEDVYYNFYKDGIWEFMKDQYKGSSMYGGTVSEFFETFSTLKECKGDGDQIIWMPTADLEPIIIPFRQQDSRKLAESILRQVFPEQELSLIDPEAKD